jgi:hypothetical protein
MLRPYSWIHSLLIGFCAGQIANQTSQTNLIISGIYALLLYALLILILELNHKDVGRPKLSIFHILIFSIPIFIISIQSILSLTFTIAFVIFTEMYSLKKRKLWGLYSFLMRGLIVLAHFFATYFLFTNLLVVEALIFSCILSLLISARNLIADIRDIKYDKNTFSVIFGVKKSKIVTIALLFASAIFASYINIWFAIILLLLTGVIYFIENAFLMHRLMLLMTTVFLSLFLFVREVNYIVLLLIPLDIIANIFFYKKIFRKSNKEN